MLKHRNLCVLYSLLILDLTTAIVNINIRNYGRQDSTFFMRFRQPRNQFGPWPLTQLIKGVFLTTNTKLPARCKIAEKLNEIHNTLRSVSPDRVKGVSENQMENILKACNSNRAHHPAASSNTPQRTVNLIWPGTKWCGNGNISTSYDDLGRRREEDKCCREHDMCQDIIPAGNTREDLTNDSPYTRLHCNCDHTFWNCLREVNSLTSNTIGDFYFNIFKNKCYKKEYPIIGCITWHSKLLQKSCQEYEFDYTKPKIWQWFDAKEYKKP